MGKTHRKLKEAAAFWKWRVFKKRLGNKVLQRKVKLLRIISDIKAGYTYANKHVIRSNKPSDAEMEKIIAADQFYESVPNIIRIIKAEFVRFRDNLYPTYLDNINL